MSQTLVRINYKASILCGLTNIEIIKEYRRLCRNIEKQGNEILTNEDKSGILIRELIHTSMEDMLRENTELIISIENYSDKK